MERGTSPYQGLLLRLREHAGLHMPSERHVDIAGATRRAMRGVGIDCVETYVGEIEAGRVSLSALLEEITVGETYFFREPEQFAFLRDVVLPRLVDGAGPCRPLRIWSAGCASGEEPYSLAILMTELGLGARAAILGTDISNRALEKALAADYGAWSLRGPDAYRARGFLTPTGKVLHLDEKIRRLVSFRELNLAKDVYPCQGADADGFDLIVCRNVFIYFDPETIARAARSFYDSLAEGGWLILGSSDPPLAGLAPFERVVTERGIFYRRGAEDNGSPGMNAGARREASPPVGRTAGHAPTAESLPGSPPAGRAWPSFGAPAFQAGGRKWRSRSEQCSGLTAGVPAASGEKDARHSRRESLVVLEPPSAAVTESSVASSVRALANAGDIAGAKAVALAAIEEEPLDAEAHYLLAVVLIELRRDAEAVDILRRVVYVDPKFVVAHLALGLALVRIGEREAARRAFRAVRRLCAALPGTALPSGRDGESAAYLATIAEAEEARLAPRPRSTP